MTLSMPTGEISSGMLYITSTSTAPESLPILNIANQTLTTTGTGDPIFVNPLKYITLINNAFTSGIPAPNAGSPVIQATADIYGGVDIPFDINAYTGIIISLPTPVDANFSTWLINYSIPVYAKSLNITSSGAQTLGGIMLALYTSTTAAATAPVAKAYIGNAGTLYYSSLENVSFEISTGAFPTSQNLYLCAFFDSQWATSNMGLVLNGIISATNTSETIGGQINGTVTQVVLSSQYFPT
ncbi:MAG: hypothetical protein ACRC6D_14620 [Aeromonas sp.]